MANFFGRGGGSVQYNNVPSIAAAAGSLASAGGTETLVADGTGPDMTLKGLTAGTGITLTGGLGAVTVTNASPASSVTLESPLTGNSLVSDGTGPALITKDLIAGTGITLTPSGTDITVVNASPASGVTLTSAGGQTLVSDGTGPSLQILGIDTGAGTAVTASVTAVTVTPLITQYISAAYSWKADLGGGAFTYNQALNPTVVRVSFTRAAGSGHIVASSSGAPHVNNFFTVGATGTYVFFFNIAMMSGTPAADLFAWIRRNATGPYNYLYNAGANSVDAEMQMWCAQHTIESNRVKQLSGVWVKALTAGDYIDVVAGHGVGIADQVTILEASMFAFRLL